MNRHALRTMQMIKSLSDANVWTHRRQPSFLWSVQSFNMHQLANTGLDAAALLSHLRNASSKPEAGAEREGVRRRDGGSRSAHAGSRH